MADRKNQHFVPQFYFKFFSKDKKSICVYRKWDEKVVPTAPIKNQSSKPWFYGSDGVVEKELGNLEGHLNTTLRKIIDNKSLECLTEEYKAVVRAGIMLQRVRTSLFRDAHEFSSNKMAQYNFELMVNKNQGFSPEEKASYIKEIEVKADLKTIHLMMMKTALENNHLISDLKMILLINKTNRPFVFSDNPVVFYNKYLYSITHFGVLGMRTPGLKIFYPLSPDLCLLLIDKSKYNIKRIFNESIIKINNLKDVNSLNKLQIHSAQNCVYFHDHNLFDYISYLCRTEYTTLRKYENSYSETEVEKFDDGGAKDLIHTYAPQIPYFLELSFIKEIPIVGNGTPIDRSFYD